jgi:hypothetical protein
MQKHKVLLVLILLMATYLSFCQKTDSTRNVFHFKGAVTVTNKGISLVPTFTLGKPAAIFDLSMGKRKLYFEPQLRFALEGKPWSFLFWWRYRLINKNKVAVTLGAHPAMNFKTETWSENGISKNAIVTRRYLAGELVPNYFVSKNVSVGLYYLYSHCFDKGTAANTHFLTINSNFSRIKLIDNVYLRFTPQFYYLNQDGKDGFYFTSTFTFIRAKFPLFLQSIINKTIRTDVPGSQNFVWNISLIYSFNKKYVEP